MARLAALGARGRDLVARTPAGFALWRRLGGAPAGRPGETRDHATLATAAEWRAARAEARRLGLPPHVDPPKTWDSLLALAVLLRRVPATGRVLDAGSAWYSVLLYWLARYGYRRLDGIGLALPGPARRGPIRYHRGDLTRAPFPDAAFDAITCLSVVEHGVDLDAYLAEAARLLRPGGVLVTSTDYWETPVDTGGRTAYGAPVRVFTRDDILDLVARAGRHGLRPASPLTPEALACRERAVHWPRLDLRFTFVTFTLEREPGRG